MQRNKETHLNYSIQELQQMKLDELMAAIPAGTRLCKNVVEVLLGHIETVLELLDICSEKKWRMSRRANNYINSELNVNFKGTLSKYQANRKSLQYQEAAA